MAAAGKFAEMTSFDQLIAAVNRLVADVESGKDPLALDTYWDVYGDLKSGKGRKFVPLSARPFWNISGELQAVGMGGEAKFTNKSVRNGSQERSL